MKGVLASIAVLSLGIGACGGGGTPYEILPPVKSKVRDLHVQGQKSLRLGDRETAKATFEDARMLAEGIDDQPGLVQALNDLGAIHTAEGNVEAGVALHRQALAMAEGLGDTSLLISSLTHLGTAVQLGGETDEAVRFYSRALDLARQTEDQRGEAVLHNNLGLIYRRGGQSGRAAASFQSALELNQKLEDRSGQASNHLNLGLLAEDAGKLDEAEHEFTHALTLDKETENREAIAGDLTSLARVLSRQNRTEQALVYAQRAYWSYRALGDRTRALKALHNVLELLRVQRRQDLLPEYEGELQELEKAGAGNSK